MRRLIAGLTGTLVIGAVAAVVLGPTQASLAGAPTVSPTLSPPPGQTAIAEGDVLSFGGQVTPGSVKVSAFIHFKRADGRAFREPMRVTSRVLIDSAGKITGDRGVNLSPDPTWQNNSENADGGYVYLELTMRDPDDQKETTARSNDVEIDLAEPVINKTRLTAPNTIVVVFSEEVDLPTQDETETDWGVEVARSGDEIIYATPTDAVKTSPTEITLTTAHTHDQDATPHVVYQAGLGADPTRETYHDTSAKNPYGGNLYFLAQDLIPPPVPTIDSVAGRTVTTLQANDPTPEIRLSGLRSGHWAEIYREANGQPGLQRPGDAFIGEDQADSSGAQVTTNDLGSDGRYELYALARDNAVCDPSDTEEPAPCHNRSAGTAPIVYTLDRIGPAPLFAAATRVGEITVGFTEAVTGSNSTSNWKVDGQTPVTVTGAGDRRTIVATNAVPGATLTYTPGDYVDEAGNPLPAFSAVLFDQLPPLVQVTDPANDQFVQASSYTIRGTASKADQVQIFRDADGNGEPEGEPVATAPVNGDAWSVSVPLNVDASNRFVARGLRTDNNPPIQGPNVPINSALVQDSQAPTLELEPFSTAYRGDFQVDIAWSADDANLGGGPMTLEFSPDGGATWQLIEAFYPDT